MSYYSIGADVFGMATLGVALKKAKEGKEVNALFDSMADGIGLSFQLRYRDYMQELAAVGAKVGYYNPVYKRLFREGFAALSQMHDKILVIDGEYFFIGGRNIRKDYFASPKDMPNAWLDKDVGGRGLGPAAALTGAVSAELNNPDVVSLVKPDAFNKVSREAELYGAAILMDEWLARPPLSEEKKEEMRKYPDLQRKLVASMVESAVAKLPEWGYNEKATADDRALLIKLAKELVSLPEMAGAEASYRARAEQETIFVPETKVIDRTAAANPTVDDVNLALSELVDGASYVLRTQNPYVVLTEPMLKVLEAAAHRDIKIYIEIVSNSPLSTDSAVTQAYFLQDWTTVLARVPTARLFVFTGIRKMHAKASTEDYQMSLVSTINYDLISTRINSEVGLVMLSQPMALALGKSIDADKADPANGLYEWKIQRDEQGQAVRGADGEFVVLQGPNDHLSKMQQAKYAVLSSVADWARNRFDLLESLRIRRTTLEEEAAKTNAPAT